MPYIYKSGLQFGINETNIYGGASYVELTQAEYDALSDAEKHNGQIYFITDGNYDFLIVNDSVPIGSIQAYGGATAPSGWLICDGSAISRTDYKELFQAIGISFGEGDGGTTFNIPDLRGRITIGNGLGTASDAVNRTIGQTGGSEKITLSVNQIPSHSHTTGISGSVAGNYNSGGSSAQVSFNQTVGVNTGLTGGGQAHDNMQPYLTTNYIIKAKNPSIASGQQLQAMELFYPVGSYFETSDSTFDPNVEWGGTWSLNSIINEEESLIYNGSFSTGTTSLTNNVNNYNKIKILAIDNDGTLKTFEVTNENSNAFSTYLDFGRVAGGWYAKCMVVAFNGTSMTENFNRQAYFSTISAEGTYVTVKKVYGYKQIISYKWKRTA